MTKERLVSGQRARDPHKVPSVYPDAVFAGFFSLGRKPTAIQQLIFSLADGVIAPSVFLVADTHFPEKLHAFIRGDFRDRLLPTAPDTDVLEVFFEDLDGFDTRDYEQGVAMLRTIDPALLELVSGLDWSGRHPACQHTRRRFDSFVQSKIIPAVVRRRLLEYGASLSRVRVFSQRGIQQSAFKISSGLKDDVVRRNLFLEGSRRGGLMFNLFNELALLGVNSCTHFCVGRFGSLFVEAEENLERFLRSSQESSDVHLDIHGLPFRASETANTSRLPHEQRRADFVAIGRGLSVAEDSVAEDSVAEVSVAEEREQRDLFAA